MWKQYVYLLSKVKFSFPPLSIKFVAAIIDFDSIRSSLGVTMCWTQDLNWMYAVCVADGMTHANERKSPGTKTLNGVYNSLCLTTEETPENQYSTGFSCT